MVLVLSEAEQSYSYGGMEEQLPRMPLSFVNVGWLGLWKKN